MPQTVRQAKRTLFRFIRAVGALAHLAQEHSGTSATSTGISWDPFDSSDLRELRELEREIAGFAVQLWRDLVRNYRVRKYPGSTTALELRRVHCDFCDHLDTLFANELRLASWAFCAESMDVYGCPPLHECVTDVQRCARQCIDDARCLLKANRDLDRSLILCLMEVG